MKTPSSSSLLGITLLVVAGLFLVLSRHGPAYDRDQSPASSGQRTSGNPARNPSPVSPTGTAAPSSEPPLVLTGDGLPDFSNYDRNGDGDPEVDAFLSVYRRVDSSACKIDMLENVRTFETSDEPRLNDLLIDQAAKAENAEVREAARDALFEHGGAKAHDSLGAYLKSETRVADRAELEKLLGNLQLSPLSLVRSAPKNPPTPPSPPETNELNK